MNLNILFITPSYKPAYIYGGPTFSVSKLAEQLTSICNVQVVTTTANGNSELDVESNKNIIVNNVNVIYFKRQTKDHSHLSLQLLKYVWENSKKYDVVHIHSWWNLVSIFSLCICLLKKCDVVISPRGMLSKYTINNSKIKSFAHLVFKKVFYNKTNLHLTSSYELNQVRNLNSLNKYQIPNLLLDISSETHSFENKNDILFLSRIEKKKNIEMLIVAMSNIAYGINLNIVGGINDNYFKYLNKLAHKLNVHNRIFWSKPLYAHNKNEIIAKSKLLILPSKDENFANIVLEALINGTAVIISENVGLSDFVLKYNLGWVLKENDNLADVIDAAYNDSEKLKYIYVNAKEIVLNEFNDNKLLQQYLQMYISISNRNHV